MHTSYFLNQFKSLFRSARKTLITVIKNRLSHSGMQKLAVFGDSSAFFGLFEMTTAVICTIK